MPAEEPQPKQFPQTVLVVEDEVLIRLSIAEYLRERGLAVMEAASADEARAVFLAGLTVDAVFTDVHMPGGEDGLALAKWLAEQHPDVAVLLTSGVTTSQEAAEANVLFISKPYAHQRVYERIRDLLDARAHGS